MAYLIGELTFSEARAALEIDGDTYDGLREARTILSSLHRWELRREIVLGAFRDFERTMFEIALREKAKDDFGREFFSAAFVELNLSLNSLLTSATMYVHQISRSFTAASKEAIALSDFKTQMSAMYDSRFGFRVMEALRNHSQHHQMPVSSVNYAGKAIEDGPVGWRNRSTVDPYILVSDLLSNAKFKKSLRNEIESAAISTIDVKHCVREYVSGLESVHHSIRSIVKADLEGAISLIYRAMDAYATHRGGSAHPSVFFAWDSACPDDAVYLGRDSIEETRRLTSTSDRSAKIRKSYISTEVAKIDKNIPL